MVGTPPPSHVDPADQPRQDGDAPSQTDAEARRALREAALAAAQAAEQEAADASNERDAAAERVRTALARAVKARAAAVDPVEQPHAGGDMSVTHAMMLHEAAAVLNLHAQAVSVQNARSLVPTVLDTAGNYPRWREQFLLAVTKYSLLDHVHSDSVSALADWTRMDAVVKSWLYSTVSADLADAVIDHRASAREAWLAIEDHFLGNQETRALHLDAKFRAFAQGDLYITEYCKRFKKMADDLADLNEHVTDRTLVLNVLRGLNERYKDIGVHLRRGRPFPSFAAVRNELLLEEINMVQHPVAPSTALVATGSSRQPAATGGGPPRTGGGAPKPKNKKKKDRRAGGDSAPGPSAPPAPSSAPGAPAGSGATWPSVYNPWTGSIQMWPGPRTPPLAPLPQGRAGPQQQALQQALLAQQMQLPQPAYLPAPGVSVQQAFQPQQLAPSHYQPMVGSPVWDQNSLASTFSTMTVTPPVNNDWYLDTGASSHMTSHDGTLSHSSTPRFPSPTSIVVGNGSLLPVTATGKAQLGPLVLNNVLVSPQLIKNLISVRQFTVDNNCSVEFDPYGCSVKDLFSRNVIIRCNSSGPLYPLQLPVAHSLVASSSPPYLWHRRLGHPGREALSKLASAIPACNKSLDSICHACQLGRHVRLPFGTSASRASNNFDLIHCDLWTSPVVSVSGYKYYLVVLDDCSHYLWTFPLRLKSDTFTTLSNFFAYVSTQFGTRVKAVQSDNGKEFDNSSTHTFFLTHGVLFRMSCPYTSPQNGKAERIIRTTNDVIRSLLFQASMPPPYWAEALHTATLLNILPTKTLDFSTPHSALLGSAPSYDHLRVFGCKCYPNLSATAPHKLAPRSALCIFLGYSAHHKGYRCLDPTTNRIIISRHVVFDESTFPFAEQTSPPTAADFTFLDEFPNPTVPPIGLPTMSSAGSPGSRGAVLPAPPVPPGFPALPRAGAAPRATSTSSSPTGALLSSPRVATPASSALPRAGQPDFPALPRAAPSPPGAQPPVLRVYSRRPKPAAPAPAGPAPAPAPTAPAAPPAPGPLPRGAVAVPPTVNQHRMVTRAKDGFRVPVLYHAAPLSPVPKTFRSALADPNWRAAMEEEHAALLQNQTWELVPRP